VHEDEADRPKLPLDAVVVRAGVMELDDLRDNARNHYDRVSKYEDREEWALSVNSIPDLSAEEIAKRTKKLNRKMCVSTVGAIEALDCVSEVRSDWREDGHSNIVFHAEPSWDDLMRVKEVFSGPLPNPGRPL
jgi:hypothetical protein